jgi:translocator protein
MLSRTVRSLLSLAAFGGITAAAAIINTRATDPKRNAWYRALRKPAFQPPNLLFPLVWTPIYAAMAISANRIAGAPPSPVRTRALALWGVQLALNAAWSPLFFNRRRPRLALADMTALIGAVTAYTAEARRIDPGAELLMAPYLAWLSFAAALNTEIIRLNPRLANDRLFGR